MKITHSDCISRKLQLIEPYEIAYETIDHAVNLFLRIETACGTIGYGCAAPDLEVTHETEETVQTIFKDVIEPGIKGKDPLMLARILDELSPDLERHPSAKAMLDMALFDLLAKKCSLPLFQVLGGFRHRILTSITMGILPITESVQKADEFVQRGFKILKIKGGNDVNLDIERLAKIREKVGDSVHLRFDANQGYSYEDTLKFAQETAPNRIEFIEQPTPRKELDLLGQVTRNIRMPVMADESVMNLADVFMLGSKELADTVNIKIQKVGGIMEALHMNSVAKAAQLEVMVGCMDESALGISAGLHFALARPNVWFADLDGHFDWVSDPFEGTVLLQDGYLLPRDQSGLGAVHEENLF